MVMVNGLQHFGRTDLDQAVDQIRRES